MSRPLRSLEIDRLVLEGPTLAGVRPGSVRQLVETEVRRLPEVEGWPEGAAGGEATRLLAPSLELPGPPSEGGLARGVARSIVQTLRGNRASI